MFRLGNIARWRAYPLQVVAVPWSNAHVEEGPSMVDTPRIVVITASIGAGHDGAADELIRRLRGLGFAVDRHDFIDLMPAGLGRHMNAAYKRQLFVAPRTWGWFL